MMPGTISVAVAGPEFPSLVDVTVPVVLRYGPMASAVTLIVTVQLPVLRNNAVKLVPRRPISRTRAIRVRGRPTTRRPSSTPSTRATPRRTHDLRISHVTIDRKHTTAEDLATYFPLAELHRRAASGGIGLVASRFHGAPTNRSHRVTLEVDGPEIVARCMADEVDAAILVPNCPVCHQTVSLVARMLEVSGISTVVMGCA
jgi:hypothetical protein